MWSVTGSLPAGLTFAAGQLTGTPATAGIYHVEVAARDATNAHASRAYTFAVNPAGLSITTSGPLPDAVVGEPYGVRLSASVPSGTWSAHGVASGLSMSPAGVISGTPMPNGSATTVAIAVVAPDGLAAFKAVSLTVRDPPLFTDPLYTPRGDGNTGWQPPRPAPPVDGLPVGPLLRPTTPGDLSKVDHIVVVMMENRSFDHLLGYLSREGGRTDVDGLRWEAGDDRTQFNYYNGRHYYPRPLTDTRAFYTEAMGPDHSHESVKPQMADGMGHFVSDYAKNKVGDDPAALQLVMGYYDGSQLPIYDMLAREFAICDHWFCSHPGPTWPNRFVTLTGDAHDNIFMGDGGGDTFVFKETLGGIGHDTIGDFASGQDHIQLDYAARSSTCSPPAAYRGGTSNSAQASCAPSRGIRST